MAASITGRYAIRNKCYHPSILPPSLHPSNDTKSPGPSSRLESFYKDSYNTLEIRRKEGRSEGTNERTEEKRKKRRDEIFFPRARSKTLNDSRSINETKIGDAAAALPPALPSPLYERATSNARNFRLCDTEQTSCLVHGVTQPRLKTSAVQKVFRNTGMLHCLARSESESVPRSGGLKSDARKHRG